MTQLTGTTRVNYIRGMFSSVAPSYDLLNKVMTFGQDRNWREFAVRMAELPHGKSILLDLGGGTGGLGIEAKRNFPKSIPVVSDFSMEMMRIGRKRPGTQFLWWSAADGLNLPYPDNIFDAVVSGFLLRNVENQLQVLREQFRVVKPGCRVVILETTPPEKDFLRPLVYIYMHWIIPFLGRLIAGEGNAYNYLSNSSDAFLPTGELAEQMIIAGFRNIEYKKINFGTIAVHWGEK